MIRRFRLFICVLALVSCNSVKIENGEVPDGYLDAAAQFVGDYDGEFNGQKGTLSVSLDGNKLRLEFSNSAGNDIIDSACESSIGDLVSVSVRDLGDGEYVFRRASFNFSPNKCSQWILGDSIDVSIRVNDDRVKLVLALLEEYSVDRFCRQEPPPPAGSGRLVCDSPRAEYIRGEFTAFRN